MVSKRFYVYAGEAITPLGLLRHGLIATRAPHVRWAWGS